MRLSVFLKFRALSVVFFFLSFLCVDGQSTSDQRSVQMAQLSHFLQLKSSIRIDLESLPQSDRQFLLRQYDFLWTVFLQSQWLKQAQILFSFVLSGLIMRLVHDDLSQQRLEFYHVRIIRELVDEMLSFDRDHPWFQSSIGLELLLSYFEKNDQRFNEALKHLMSVWPETYATKPLLIHQRWVYWSELSSVEQSDFLTTMIEQLEVSGSLREFIELYFQSNRNFQQAFEALIRDLPDQLKPFVKEMVSSDRSWQKFQSLFQLVVADARLNFDSLKKLESLKQGAQKFNDHPFGQSLKDDKRFEWELRSCLIDPFLEFLQSNASFSLVDMMTTPQWWGIVFHTPGLLIELLKLNADNRLDDVLSSDLKLKKQQFQKLFGWIGQIPWGLMTGLIGVPTFVTRLRRAQRIETLRHQIKTRYLVMHQLIDEVAQQLTCLSPRRMDSMDRFVVSSLILLSMLTTSEVVF